MSVTPTDYGPDELYDLREKVRNGEDVSPEEYKAVVAALRQGRETTTKTKAKKAAAKKPTMAPEQIDDLLNSFVSE